MCTSYGAGVEAAAVSEYLHILLLPTHIQHIGSEVQGASLIHLLPREFSVEEFSYPTRQQGDG